MEGYCVKCKAKREMKNGKKKAAKNGTKMMAGKCAVCGCKMCVFLPGAKKAVAK